MPSQRIDSLPTITPQSANATADAPANATLLTANQNPHLPSAHLQPLYPSPSAEPDRAPKPQIRLSTPTRWGILTTPFGRSRAGTGGSSVDAQGHVRRTSAASARLWNPTNSTPRTPVRLRTPEDRPVVPLRHPAIRDVREETTAGGDYPLLSLPEQRQVRHSGSSGRSLQVDRSADSSDSNRISLPRSVSIDINRSPTPLARSAVEKGKGTVVKDFAVQADSQTTGLERRGQASAAVNMSIDIERGGNVGSPYGNSTIPNQGRSSTSNLSLHSHGGIGPALSSNNTSIIGDPDDGPINAADEWGPAHPCFPHMNPHVPLSSPLYQTTRIIRIRRDWMIEGDLAPTFSNLYPEILDPAGVSEQEFRRIIEQVNDELVPAFNPWAAQNIFDGFMGLLTGWIWDDLGLTGVKRRLRNVERFLEAWNLNMEEKSHEVGTAPKIVSLRRTGYMNVSAPHCAWEVADRDQLDIQVKDPEVFYPAPSSRMPAEEGEAFEEPQDDSQEGASHFPDSQSQSQA